MHVLDYRYVASFWSRAPQRLNWGQISYRCKTRDNGERNVRENIWTNYPRSGITCFRMLLRYETERFKDDWESKMAAKFRTFWPAVKIRREWVKYLSRFHCRLGPNLNPSAAAIAAADFFVGQSPPLKKWLNWLSQNLAINYRQKHELIVAYKL